MAGEYIFTMQSLIKRYGRNDVLADEDHAINRGSNAAEDHDVHAAYVHVLLFAGAKWSGYVLVCE